ncbi:hypothetical protein B0H11DRAFT_2251891 [Mycena galericulata]|nr:hypothetical protein B0H11DRAFT_2251891 [Mycena galericulata]
MPARCPQPTSPQPGHPPPRLVGVVPPGSTLKRLPRDLQDAPSHFSASQNPPRTHMLPPPHLPAPARPPPEQHAAPTTLLSYSRAPLFSAPRRGRYCQRVPTPGSRSKRLPPTHPAPFSARCESSGRAGGHCRCCGTPPTPGSRSATCGAGYKRRVSGA